MTKYHPVNGMLAGAQLCKMNGAWKPQTDAKITGYTFLIFKNGSKIDFKNNICLVRKVICQWK